MIELSLQILGFVFQESRTSYSRLIRYFETDDMIYLVLEYVAHGQLLPIVRPYLERQVNGTPTTTMMNVDDPTSINRDLSPFSTSSVIKPSPSFVQIRRKSIQPGKTLVTISSYSRNELILFLQPPSSDFLGPFLQMK